MGDFPFNGPLEDGPSDELYEALPERFSIYDVWRQYIDQVMTENWRVWTNERANELKRAKPESRPSWYRFKHWPPKYAKRWKNIQPREMEIFLGTMIAKNCIAKVPKNLFWGEITRLRLQSWPHLSGFMSRDRYSTINSLLTIYPADDGPDEPSPPYWKVGNLIHHFNANCRRNYSASRHCSRDEQCIKNHHRTPLRHYRMPKRMITEGIRVECVTSKGGVMLQFMLDLPGVTHHEQTLNLIRTLKYEGHVVYMDRLYTSLKLLLDAKQYCQYVCGTSSVRRGFPPQLAEHSEVTDPGLEVVISTTRESVCLLLDGLCTYPFAILLSHSTAHDSSSPCSRTSWQT